MLARQPSTSSCLSQVSRSQSILCVFIHKSPFVLLTPIGWSPQCILSIMPTIQDTLNNTIFIFNICNNLSSRHEETLTITRVPASRPWLPDVTCQCLSSHPLLTISIFQNVRMMRFMHRNLGRLCVGISSCLSEAFMTKMWAMLWERWGERGAISKNYRESNKRPVPNSSDDFYFYAERVLEKMTNKEHRKNIPVLKTTFYTLHSCISIYKLCWMKTITDSWCCLDV